ncbi:unnamed protein product [Tilletia caries]|nr:unnamed protein product [Tilletia caries]
MAAAIAAAVQQQMQQQQRQTASTSPAAFASQSAPDSAPASTSASNTPATQAQDQTKLVWTKSIAQQISKQRKGKNDARYSKEDVMMAEDGAPLNKDRIKEVETVTRLACIKVDTHDYDPPIPSDKRTYRRLRSDEFPLLIEIAKQMEDKCVELSYCDDHYKALLFIELHLKAKNEIRKKRIEETRASSKTSSRTASTVAGSSKSKDARSIKSFGKRLSLFSEDEDDDDADKQPRSKKPKAISPVQRLNALAKTSSARQIRLINPTIASLNEHLDTRSGDDFPYGEKMKAALVTLQNAKQIAEIKEKKHGSCCGTHIEQVCTKIESAFKLSSSNMATSTATTLSPKPTTGSKLVIPPKESTDVAVSEGVNTAAEASASASNIGSKKTSGHGRNRVAKELENGIVSEAALRSLQKKAAVALLERKGMTTGKRQSREDVLDALVAAHKNGKIKLTAATIKAARANILNDDE